MGHLLKLYGQNWFIRKGNMQKKLTIFLILISFCTPLFADSISNTSGAVAEGEALQLNGTFSANTLTMLFDKFEDGNITSNPTWYKSSVAWTVTQTANRNNSNYVLQKSESAGNLSGAEISPVSATANTFYYSFWMLLASDYPEAQQNNKWWRAGNQTTDLTNLNVGAQMTMEKGTSGTSVVWEPGQPTRTPEEGKPTVNTWYFFEVIWEIPFNGNSDNYASLYFDGVLQGTISDKWYAEAFDSDNFLTLGNWYNTDDGMGSYWLYDDVYYDTSLSAIVLGNASTIGLCTVKEMQLPTSWSAFEITITEFNAGAFNNGDTAYLYVRLPDGTYSEGYAVTIGSTSGITTSLTGNIQLSGGITI